VLAAIRCCVIALALMLIAAALPGSAWIRKANAQAAQSANTAAQQLSPDALERLVGPIALYPDDLLSIVLPAATQPLQIVEAQRFLDQHKANPSLKPPSTWDPSVVALLNYPDVLSMMNHDLDWTQQLGNAVVAQQTDVLNAIQAFRKKVYDAGNLKTNDKQSVTTENQTILVQSANPQTIYVPQYDPQVVVAPVAVGAPAPYYYSPPYPYYASPAATFATGAIFGTAVGFAIGWASHGIYSGNWGWGGYYGGGNVNVNRVNNINVNNAQITAAQRTQFNNRITQNRENAWRPDQSAIARQQASFRTGGQAARVNASQIRSGLANRPAGTGGNLSPQARQNAQSALANRGGVPNRQPGAGIGNRTRGNLAANLPSGGALGNRPGAGIGNRTPNTFAANHPSFGGGQGFNRQGFSRGGGQAAFQSRGGAFGGFQNGAAANRFSNRGNASLRASGGFAGGGGRFQGGGGGFRGGGGAHGFRR